MIRRLHTAKRSKVVKFDSPLENANGLNFQPEAISSHKKEALNDIAQDIKEPPRCFQHLDGHRCTKITRLPNKASLRPFMIA